MLRSQEQNRTTRKRLIYLFLSMGFGLIILNLIVSDKDRVLEEDVAWKVSVSATIAAEKGQTTVQATIPRQGTAKKIIGQHFYHPSLRLQANREPEKPRIVAQARRTGNVNLITEYHIQVSPAAATQPVKTRTLEAKEREKYLSSDTHVDLTFPALMHLSKSMAAGLSHKSEIITRFFAYSQNLVQSESNRLDDIISIIPANKATTLGRARMMVALCRLQNIPARLVTGLILQEQTSKLPHYWVEIYGEDENWYPYDPEKGYARSLPGSYLIFNYDNPDIITVENGQLLSVKYSVVEDLEILNVARLEQEKRFIDIFDLRRLDFETRQTLIKILILPFCILLTAVFRHVLGFFPYGTFTAALLALAMVYAEPLVTLVLAGIVLALALIGRSILPDSCPRAPRLSLIFTFVALSMVFSISFLSYFSINPGGNIILLPIVILASIVDRFYSYMDEAGTHAALLRLGVTVLIAVVCIPILQFEALGNLILAYPETHFITVALVLMLSGYSGKKLSDLPYLRLLGENKVSKKIKKKSGISGPLT